VDFAACGKNGHPVKSMMKKETKNSEIDKILKRHNKEVMRHFDIVAEGIKDEVAIIAEQYGDIRQDISSIKETLNTHTEMIGSMAEDVSIIKADVEFLKGGLKKKVDYEEFAALERRLALVESKIRR